MAFLQSPPRTPEELELSKPLDISPDEVAQMDEKTWYERAYRGDSTPQLTLRALLMGSFLGFFLAFTNLYVGLKTGWALGVALTACILSYSIWRFLERVGAVSGSMTILENNCMQSTASSAGYSTGVLMVSANSALLMMSVDAANPQGQHMSWPLLAAWTLTVAVLGVMMAIPMKRSLINRERLQFPSGVAAASTLQSLYASGQEAVAKSRALLWSAVGAGLFPLLIDLNLVRRSPEGSAEPLLPASSPLFDWIPALGTKINEAGQRIALKSSDWTMVMDHNPVMIGAGALVGLRVAISMVAGALLLAYGIGPFGLESEWVNSDGVKIFAVSSPGAAWKELGLWFGAPLMVASSLAMVSLQWKTVVRAISGFFGQKAEVREEVELSAEVPSRWMAVGFLVSGAAVVAITATQFDVPVFYGILAVLLTFVLTLVAARATGESDITPMGAMGKITQLTYGVLLPQSPTANLMTAGITSGAAIACADLLNDLKSGYLLGADPRRQFLAQLAGTISGTVASVVGFYILVPDATALLGTPTQPPQFPAPAAQAWRAVAELFRDGIENMHISHRYAIFAGCGVGVLLTAIETLAPRIRNYLPSATGLGLGLILPFQYPFSMLLGAVAAYVWKKRNSETAKRYLVPVSAGIIAGVSIVGVFVAALNNFLL